MTSTPKEYDMSTMYERKRATDRAAAEGAIALLESRAARRRRGVPRAAPSLAAFTAEIDRHREAYPDFPVIVCTKIEVGGRWVSGPVFFANGSSDVADSSPAVRCRCEGCDHAYDTAASHQWTARAFGPVEIDSVR